VFFVGIFYLLHRIEQSKQSNRKETIFLGNFFSFNKRARIWAFCQGALSLAKVSPYSSRILRIRSRSFPTLMQAFVTKKY